MDRLSGMVVFVRAAELRSFTAAASVLGMSAQMVGRYVAALEARLGTRLLNRTTRRQSLTAAGQLYYERCRAVLADADAADAAVQALSEAPRGRLRVNAPVTFGTFRLAPLVARYLEAFAEVQVELMLSDRYVDIVEEGYDLVVRLGALRDSTLTARALAPYRLVACAAPSYLARRGVPERPEELAAHECLSFVSWSGLPLEEWVFRSAGETKSVRIGGRYRSNDARALRDAAVAGRGVILQAEAVVAEELGSGRLVRLLPDWDGPVREMHLLFAGGRPMTPKLRRFVEMMVAEFGA